MYKKHFTLNERPFSIAPDPRFLYMSARHREALAHLLYGLDEDGGFVQLTGEVGTGKTTICRCLLEQVPENVDLALVLNPKVTAAELIATVCDELGIEHAGEDSSIKALTDVLNQYLLDAYARGRHTVLIIDEAQNLSADVLEQVRLLTNLETATQKLLRIILIGQPELRSLLAREDMRQLSQRITARYHLDALSREETGAYIKHRLQICGATRSIFSRGAINRIHRLSGGVPRLINVLCDRALLGAFVEGKTQVDKSIVAKAAKEVLDEEADRGSSYRVPVAAGAALLVALLAFMVYQPLRQGPPGAASQQDPQNIPARDTSGTISGQPESASAVAMTAKPERKPGVPARQQSLATLLLEIQDADARAAWIELLDLWSVAAPSGEDPDFCQYAAEYGLFCVQERGSWEALRQFDRPAILELVTADGRQVPVVLQHLGDSVAELVIGSELHRLSVEQVGRYWYGDYTMLLQAPPGGRMYLRAGQRNADVVWLREQLGKALGVKIPAQEPQYFDFELQKHVLEFQRSRDLVADGVVGRHTLIHLNTSAGRAGVPRLSTETS
ncbi:MAG: AAA family ATPase [Gammaproteobacteria bacterium]|jgi:general secretion pathway protein A